MGINKKTLVLSSSQLINLISETVVLVEQNEPKETWIGAWGWHFNSWWYNDFAFSETKTQQRRESILKEIKRRKDRKPCEILSYIQGKTGFRVADAGDIQQYLIDRGVKIKKDFDFGNETAIAVGKFLKYHSATKLSINSRADLVNYLYKKYPTEFGTPADPETFGLGPRAQGVIADLLYDKCLRGEEQLQKIMARELAMIPTAVINAERLDGMWNPHSKYYKKTGYGIWYALNKTSSDKHAEYSNLENPNFEISGTDGDLGSCLSHFGAVVSGSAGGNQKMAANYLTTIVYNMRNKAGGLPGGGVASDKPPENLGVCSGKYGLFGRRGEGDMNRNPIRTLEDALITGQYCLPRYGSHNVVDYVRSKFNGDWKKAIWTDVGTFDMCYIARLMNSKVTYDYDNKGLKGLVNACKSSPLTCLEYAADAISFIAVWFGPSGWVVSAIFGFISIYAMIKQKKYGWAIIAGAFECFGVLMLIKHIKTVKSLIGYGDDTIEAGIKYFDNPTEEAFDLLSFEAKQVVKEMRASKNTIKAIMKTVDKNEIRHVIQAVSSEAEFIALVKLGKVSGLDEIGYQQFKGLQKSIRNSGKVMDKVEKGIKTVAKYTIALGGGYLASKWAANKINNAIFKKIINGTRDIISEQKISIQRAAPYTGIINYSVDTILAQDPPFDTFGVSRTMNRGMVNAIKDSNTQESAHDYTAALKLGNGEYASSIGLLMLTKLWGEKDVFPPITPHKTSCVYLSPDTDIVLDEVVNPGGGWRPNLNCLEKYHISKTVEDTTDTILMLDETINAYLEGKITEEEAQKKVKKEFHLPLNIDYTEINFSEMNTLDYEIL